MRCVTQCLNCKAVLLVWPWIACLEISVIHSESNGVYGCDTNASTLLIQAGLLTPYLFDIDVISLNFKRTILKYITFITHTISLINCVSSVFHDNFQVGDLVWKNRDAALESRLRRTYDSLSSSEQRKLAVAVEVSGSLGEPLVIRVMDQEGHVAEVVSDVTLQVMRRRAVRVTLASVMSHLRFHGASHTFWCKFPASKCMLYDMTRLSTQKLCYI